MGAHHAALARCARNREPNDPHPTLRAFTTLNQRYHVDKTQGMAVANEPQSIYAVMSGEKYNGVD